MDPEQTLALRALVWAVATATQLLGDVYVIVSEKTLSILLFLGGAMLLAFGAAVLLRVSSYMSRYQVYHQRIREVRARIKKRRKSH